jgi:hypothetical protein
MVRSMNGDFAAAHRLLKRALWIYSELGNRHEIAVALGAWTRFAAAQGQWAKAAHLGGAAESLREMVNAPLPPALYAMHNECIAMVRAALGEEAFATAWAAGHAMTMEHAIEYALSEEL